MEKSKLFKVTRWALVMALSSVFAPLFAQDAYPNRPIRIVVGYPPGGATDIGARIMAQKLTIALGQPIIVDNRAGGGGNIAAEYVARAAPDGYTIYWITSSTAISQTWYSNLKFNIVKDFAPISQVTSLANLVLVHPSLPVNSIKELVALAKASPGKLDYSTSGAGGSPHLAAEWFNAMAGINMTHIPYKGMAPQLTDLLSGIVKVAIPTMPMMPELVKQGKLRALAVTTAERDPLMPDVPTLKESGYPDYVISGWHGMAFPAGTPKAIVDRLNKEVVQIVRMPDVKATLVAAGFTVVSNSPQQFADFIEAETKKYANIIKIAKITTE